MDPDQRRRERNRLTPTADLDPARMPLAGVAEIVDHDRGASGAGDVAELLGQLELVAADVDRVARGVVDPGDRDDVRGAVGADRREPSELPAAGEVPDLGLPEDAHRTPTVARRSKRNGSASDTTVTNRTLSVRARVRRKRVRLRSSSPSVSAIGSSSSERVRVPITAKSPGSAGMSVRQLTSIRVPCRRARRFRTSGSRGPAGRRSRSVTTFVLECFAPGPPYPRPIRPRPPPPPPPPRSPRPRHLTPHAPRPAPPPPA